MPQIHAQTREADTLAAPDFSIENLETRITNTEADNTIDPADMQIIAARYQSAIQALETAEIQRERSENLTRELDSAQQIIDGLRDRLEQTERETITEQEPEVLRTDEDLQRLDRERILMEGELRNYETELAGYRAAIKNQTTLSIQDDLTRAQEALATQVNRLESMGTENLGITETALRVLLQAREYEWRATTHALEQEIAFQPTRLQILELRRDLAQLNTDLAGQKVTDLQVKTGMRRFSLANSIYAETLSAYSALENEHPFVLDYAAENLSIAQQLRDAAKQTSQYPRIRAEARGLLSEVDNDLEVADRLTSIGQFNRQSSATLQQLRDQRPSLKSIRVQIDTNAKRELIATQEQLRARQQLRGMPPGQPEFKTVYEEWLSQSSGNSTLGELDSNLLEALYYQRRDLLNKYAISASNEYRETKQLSPIHDQLLSTTVQLNGILDQNLLWLPSVKAIDAEWPQRSWRGFRSVFSLQNIRNIGDVLKQEMPKWWFPFGAALWLAGTLYVLRRRLRRYIVSTSSKVGRVQEDSYWHTPGVLIVTALRAASIPLLLLAFGIIFKSSATPDAFIDSLGQTGIELSGFAWFFLMWNEWNKDKSLFDSHYRAPGFFRQTSLRNLRWFIPVAGLSIALVTLTHHSREPDVYEGFSLLTFIITAMIIAIFGVRVLKMDKALLLSSFSESNIIRRYYRVLILLVILLPAIAAILAAIGYYDTAHVLLSRMFFTSGLILATYALYGLLRRTLLVAQRRLSLSQAQEKHEQLKLARKEKAEAEQRGESPPPQLNYDEIDVETLNRQSVQLINTFIAIGFLVALWVYWRDLFPALTVFNEVELWPSEWDESGGTRVPLSYVTLWNLIQSLAIGVLTVIAGKNLPGLLDVFVLNRSQMDRGTRYAINSVMGYIIFALGFVVAFNKLGMDWSQLQWIVAALSVGIGFGLQEIIANFISGLIILFERPIRVGDYITIGEKSGTVRRIQIRATTLSDLDNREIFIPNRELITQKVTNWTLTDSITRIIIPVGIAYGSDTEKAREIMLGVLTSNNRVLTRPKSNVFFLGFGDSSLDFELRIYVRSVDDRFAVSHDIHTEINKALGEAGFEIPFPQRDMHIRSQPDKS